MANIGFTAGIKRELSRLGSRPIYLFGMVLVPILTAIFFLGLLDEGLPEHVPTGVVDLDHSPMSRSVTRSLNALQVITLTEEAESYGDAMKMVREGRVFGFFVIPENFEKDAISGRGPTLEYYTNLTYFVPGTLAFKGFKTVAVTTAGGVVKQTLVSMGLSDTKANDMVQPIIIDQFPIGNPWMNYGIYLCPSFAMCTLALMIMLMTVMQITSEIKNYTSPQWLATCKGSISVAVTTKLLPATVIFSSIGLFILWLLFGYSHFPCYGSMWAMVAATLFLVIASQAFGLFACCAVPNPRLAFIICALFGILSFSFTGFSFPVQSMYGWLGVFSWLAPIRYWLLTYFTVALNGAPVYFARLYMAALLLFPLVPALLLTRLRKACQNPVYVP